MAIQANRQARETIDDRSTHYKPGQGMRNRSLGQRESPRQYLANFFDFLAVDAALPS
jgi:hypothetical protein